MKQPLPDFGKIFENRAAIAKMISLKEEDLASSPIQEISCGNAFLMIPIASANLLQQIKLNHGQWESLKKEFVSTGIYIFSTSDVENGYVKGRMFAPALGITEDPATGSANGPLACYLHRYCKSEFPVTSLQGFEMGRPSTIHLDITTDDKNTIDGVYVGGQSVIIGKGELFI